ncbi:hypothetical protein EMPS_07042 [Entomortierella parvispora]|uniref:Uncharacterized protein n=1 Tax=Entomortierella parvispora TaxID=205924 RepID=A0A9P3HDI9_9FUNG|nr:hypothetical protein EMPS_07042 [Entomortierella parvispora]
MLPARPLAGTDWPSQHHARPLLTRRHEPWDFQLKLTCVESNATSTISRQHVAKNRHSEVMEVIDVPPSEDEGSLSPDDTQGYARHENQGMDDTDSSASEVRHGYDPNHSSSGKFSPTVDTHSRELQQEVVSTLPGLEILSPPPSPVAFDADWARSFMDSQHESQEHEEEETYIPTLANIKPAPSSSEITVSEDREKERAESTHVAIQHQEEPLSEFAASLYNTNASAPVRSYPLRMRTFQQQKPYTADKQHHARLIGRKEASVVPTRRSAYIPDDFSNLQEDSEDSDYEEEHLLERQVETSSLPSRAASERRADSEPAPEWLLEELDDDDLPTLEEMKRQGFATSREIADRHNPGSNLSPIVRLPPKLNARAKKRLEKLARQALDPLDSLDSVPSLIPQPQERMPSHRRLLNTGSKSKSRKAITISSADGSEDEGHARDASPLNSNSIHPTSNLSESSTEEAPQPASVPKKTKKHRQHVLPMAFFKRNLIPEDAAALRSMRSKKANRSKSFGAESTSETEHVQLAHHARTRISSGQGAGKLDDFIAQLALDRSDDDSEPGGSPSDVDDGYDSRRRSSWVDLLDERTDQSPLRVPRRSSGRPIPRDTQPSSSYTRLSEPNPTRNNVDSYSDSGHDYDRSQSRERSSSPPLKSTRKRTQGERLDMIDRMIVRSSRPSTKHRSSGKDRSNKRRRISGNLQPSKYHRHHFSGDERSNQDIGPFFSDEDFSTYPVDSRPSHSRNYPRERSDAFSDGGSIPSDVEMSDGPSGRFRRSISGTPPLHQSRSQRMSYLERYDTTAPPARRRRPTIRTAVVSRKTPAAPLRWGSTVPSKKSRSTTQKKSAKPGTRTIQSQLSSWTLPAHSSGGLPQFLNKPFFEPARRVPRPAVPVALHSKSNGDNISSKDMDVYQPTDQPWDEQDDFENDSPREPPMQVQQNPSTSALSLRPVQMPTISNRNVDADTRHRLSLSSIANGLYFSRESYIGHGMLSRILKAVDDGCTSTGTITESTSSEAVFFGQSYSFGLDALATEKGFQVIKTSWTQRLEQLISEQEPISRMDNSDQHTQNDVLQAFETMTVLLIDRLSQGSYSDRCSFWRVFHEHLVLDLSKLLSEKSLEGKSSMGEKAILWGQWALVTWVILADCAIQSESEHSADLIQTLMHTAVTRSDSCWVSRIKGAEQTAASLQGVIYGQDLMEVWVCFIKLLDSASRKSRCGTFWETFNNESLNQLGPETSEQNPESDTDFLESNGRRILGLVMVLGKLHQFDRNGSSNGDLRPSANWKPIVQVLQQGWLDNSSEGGTRKSELRLREYLEFHHSLIRLWGWTPCTETAIVVYRSFATRDFRDLSTEPGYRLPEFLQRMIASPANLIMTISESVDRHDRCFEVFLKILAKTIQSQVDVIASCEDVAPVALDESQSSSNRGTSPTLNQTTSRKDLIRSCKRMLSSISPAVVTLYPVSGITNQSYSTLCNTCNLVLLIALLVPDFIRPSTVGQLRSLLNYDDSDAASRRIMLESIYYLGVIWRRSDSQDPLKRRGRSLANISDYFYGRIDSMGVELDKELKSEQNAGYISRSRRQNPIEALIETAMTYVMRLLHDKDGEIVTSFPCTSFLDRRLTRFLDYDAEYPSELRLQALGVLEYFFKLRTAYSQHLGQTSQQGTPNHNIPPSETTETPAAVAGEGFSSLDYDDFFDDIGDFDLSQMSEADAANTPSIAATSVTPSALLPQPKPLQGNPDELQLIEIIDSWIYPCLSKFISSRHQTIHDDTQQQLKSTLPFSFHHSRIGAQNALPFATTESKNSPVQQKRQALSPQAVSRLLSVFADCSMVLFDQGNKSLQNLGLVFKSENWLSLWIQHARLQDALCWANRLLEIDPEVLVANEELFLEIWFRTMGAPTSELTLQHRFMRAIMRFLNNEKPSAPLLFSNSDALLSITLFRDLPLAFLDDTVTDGKKATISFTVDVNQSLIESSRDKNLSQEFKESRLQVLSKVLSNMGEQYLMLRSGTGTGNVHRALAMKGRYQIFIGQLLQQVKQDYERLNIQKMVRDSKAHVELAHHVVGCVIQHCGLIVQNTPLTGSQDSILGYLTSSRFFPQPRLDSVYVHQKIRGYAFLYHAGEKQFFSELIELALNQLRLVAGSNSFRFNLSCEYSGTGLANGSTSLAVVSNSSALGIRVMDCHQLTYGHSDNVADESLSPSPGAQNTSLSTAHPAFGDPLPHGHHEKSGAPGLKPTIQTLVTNQGTRIKEPLEISRDALWTLTSSLRNAILETDDRKQWSMVLSGFRSLLLAALFRPLLTAFLGEPPEEGHCSSLLRIGRSPRQNITVSSSRWFATAGLITVAVPAARWLKSLVEALSNDISQLTSPGPQTNEGVPIGEGNSAMAATSPLLAFKTFQKETSVMFLPLLQSLSGCYDAVARTRLLETARELLASLSAADRTPVDFQQQISEQERMACQGLYLFGQLLQTIKSIVKVSRKTQLLYPAFYDRNRSWRETFLELLQVALDHSLDMMITLGGPIEADFLPTEDDQGYQVQADVALALGQSESIQWDSENRIPGVEDVASLESAFSEFLSSHSQSVAMESAVRKELFSRLGHPQGWAGDIMSEAGLDSAMMEDPDQGLDGERVDEHRRAPFLPKASPSSRMRRLQWILWTFLSSHLDFCQAISTLDPRFHRQVQKSLSVLLKPPPPLPSPLERAPSVSLESSVWFDLAHSARDSGGQGSNPLSSWGLLGQCLGKEWNLFLMSLGETGQQYGGGEWEKEGDVFV